jgi:hypothetical protein
MLINCLPAMTRNLNERSITNPAIEVRCRQAVTALRSPRNYDAAETIRIRAHSRDCGSSVFHVGSGMAHHC